MFRYHYREEAAPGALRAGEEFYLKSFRRVCKLS